MNNLLFFYYLFAIDYDLFFMIIAVKKRRKKL
jgi:hypothetical protein